MRFGTAIERLVDNYHYAKSKVWIRDEVAWALYHTWKEADDRKTENCSEKPNNCDTCRHNKLEWYSEVCDGCSKAHSNYEPKDEPTISKMEQVDKDINVRSKNEPKTQMKTQKSNLSFEKADEPQTDEEYINSLPWTEVGNGEQTDCSWK